MKCHFVPPYLLARIAAADTALAGRSGDTLRVDEGLRASRETASAAEGLAVHSTTLGSGPDGPAAPGWTVHDAEWGTRLPGTPVRSTGEPPVGDEAVDEAADGITATLRLFSEVFGRHSYDDQGAEVSLTVHYRRDYDNAFWDGRQLVFGDGDGEIFERFTKPVDVLGHEFGHAVIDHSAGLLYQDQSGALNESVADVFASCLSQWLAGQQVDEATWLIGEGLFRPGVQARALRDMAAPGTAYDDPVLGRDPQVGHLDDYVVTSDDNGGVHLNSGIPNKAFQLAATALGGHVWEGAGRVWYAALIGGEVGTGTDFEGFAAATVSAARAVLSEEAAGLVARSWQQVGVAVAGVPAEPSAGDGGRGGGPAEGDPRATPRVAVRRSGGFAGRVTSAEVALGPDLPEGRLAELRSLVDAVRPLRARGTRPLPDMFVYTFELPGEEPVQVPEQQLTPELRRLADLVTELGGGGGDF